MKKLKHFAEYIGVLIMDAIFSTLPASLALKGGEKVGLLFSRILPKRATLVFANLQHAFPEKSDQQRHAIAHAVWRNLGRTAVEFIRLPKINRHNYTSYFEYEGKEHVEAAARQGKGIIFIVFHFTNWEMAGVANQLDRGKTVAIARPMKNPFVEKWVQSKRRSCGMEIITHRQAVRASLKALKQKKDVGILVDQNLYQGGTFVPFFGRPAATTTLPALLVSRTGAPVIVAYTHRLKGKFKMIYEPPLEFPSVGTQEQKVQRFTEIVTEQVENVIRRWPENWFWIHNRWKRSSEAALVETSR